MASERRDFGVSGKADAWDVIGDGNLAGANEADSDGHGGEMITGWQG